MLISRAIKSQNFSAFSKVYEMSTNQISRSHHEGISIGQKKSKFIVGSTFLAAVFSSLCRYFIETTTDIDMFLQI